MNRIHHYIPLLLLAAAATAAPRALAQQLPDGGGYSSSLTGDTLIRLQGERVALDFRIDLGEPVVRRQHRRVLTPVIAADDGSRSLPLPAVIVSGRQRAVKDLRDDALHRGDEPQEVYIRLTGDARRYVDYTAQVPYEPWMESALLLLREQATGCACGPLLTADQVVSRRLLYAPVLCLTPSQEVPVEYTPRREERDAFLIYAVNRTDLHPDIYGNRAELLKIDSALTYVQRNPAYEIQRIDIAGYASPEGRYEHNVRLAEGRAEALRAYILRHYPLPDSLLSVRPGAENWEGLRKALEGFDLPHKDEVTRIIDTVEDPDQREAAIRRVAGGAPYRAIYHTLYPALRKNTFTIAYISRERTPEEARRLVFTRPEELNVHEFQTVARTFYADSPDSCLQVLRIGADTYPNHSVANANAARACLQAGLTDEAERYLMRTGNEPYTWNNRACLLWRQGRRQEAVRWWRQAADAGDEQAAHNLAELEKRGY